MEYAVIMAAPDIYHHGIKGQKWGVRRFQNKDGSLTSAGKKRYSEDGTISDDTNTRRMSKEERELFSKVARIINSSSRDETDFSDDIEYINTKLLNGSRVTNVRFKIDPLTDSLKVKSFDVEGRRAAEKVLSDSQTKATRTLVVDNSMTTGQYIAGLLIGAPLAGLSLVALRRLGMM